MFPLKFCTHALPVVSWSLSTTSNKHLSSADLGSISPFPVSPPMPGTCRSCCSSLDVVLGKTVFVFALGTVAGSIGAAGEGAAVEPASVAAMIA